MIFRIDLKIFIFLIIYYFTKQIQIYTFIMLFAFIHELGHLFAGIFLKMKIKKISIMPVGFSVEFEVDTKDYNSKMLKATKMEIKKLLIAIAGPIVNLIIVFLMLIIKDEFKYKDLIIYSNLLIAIFNLLPIYPLDGGRILKSFFNLLLDRKKTITYINYISNIVLFFCSFIGSIYIYYFKNASLFIIFSYLWYLVLKENKIYKAKINMYNTLNNL